MVHGVLVPRISGYGVWFLPLRPNRVVCRRHALKVRVMERSWLVTIVVAVVVAAIAFAAGVNMSTPVEYTTTVTQTKVVTPTVTVTKYETLTAPPKTVTATTTKVVTVRVSERVEMAPQQVNIEAELAKIQDKLSPATKQCLSCHVQFTPGIVADWLRSRHAHVTPEEAWKKPELQREISALPQDEKLRKYVVGCAECHTLNPDAHKDTFNHFGFKVHIIVSPRDCAVCHPKEVEEYTQSVKANAYYNLVKNPVYMMLVNASTQVNLFGIKAGFQRAVESACLACHGTKVEVKGMQTIRAKGGMTLQVPVLEGWPNHGVGRVNPDGSKGSCTACHPRHEFSIVVARSPYTCAQCHLDPDVPAFDVWKESKHGNIFLAEWKSYNMTAVPWVPGRDFNAPSCAVCHFSLLTDEKGNVIAPRTHNPDSRIWIRLFGVYAHPQPKTGETWKIRNKAGLPLAYCLTDGEPAWDWVISKEEMQKRRQQMIKICAACHSTDYARERIKWFEEVVNETNKAVLAATKLLVEAWQKGIAKGLPQNANPFDEYIERRWVEIWLFYAHSIRYGAAMNGPDWTTFKRGWYQLTRALEEMKMIIDLYEKASK